MVDTKKNTKLDRYYNIAKVLLALSPFVALAYISMNAAKMGTTMAAEIGQNPNMTVMFLVAMINPFIAYLLIYAHKKIDQRDSAYAVVNLVFLIVAEIMLENMIYILLLGFILYQTMNAGNVTIKESFQTKLQEKFLSTISGSLVVIVLAGICLFARIRIGA